MSTKATLAHDDNFHFYREVMEDDAVYLELTGGWFRASPSGVTVHIPIAVWETIRQYGCADLSLADKTDADIQLDAEEFVRKRLEDVARAEAEGRHPSQISFRKGFGLMGYGSADDPVEQQIASGVAYLTAERAKQRELKAEIEAVREKQRRPS